MGDSEGIAPNRHAHGVSFSEATRVWAYIGFNSFGGPAGQIAVMHRELVEHRRWVSERRFLHALNYCMLLPGPEAQQLATYLGWLMHGTGGGVAAGSLFVIPGFVAMLVLSAAYAVYGSVTWVHGFLFGLQAAVVAIVIEAVIRVGKRTLRSPPLPFIAAGSFIAIALFHLAFPYVVIASAAIGWLIGRWRPDWLSSAGQGDGEGAEEPVALLSDDETISPGKARNAMRAALVAVAIWLIPVAVLILTVGTASVFTQEALLFSKTALVTFGGAYAVLGYIAQESVSRYGWITAHDMITGLGLAETTPGPLIMVVQFVGFLAAYNHPGSLPPLIAGTLGAIITVWVTFVPCFVFIFLGAPYVERLRHNTSITHALTSVGAAVAGVILNLAIWFAVHTAFDKVDNRTFGPLSLLIPQTKTINVAAVAIACLAAALIFRLRLGTLKVLALCAGAGVLVGLVGWV